MQRRRAVALSIGTLIVVCAPVRATLAEQTVQFLDDAPITFSIVDSVEGGFDPASTSVTIAVAGATDHTVVSVTPTGPIQNVLTIDPPSAPVKNGRADFTVTPTADDTGSEATSGALVALTSDGALARLQVSIVADAPTSPTLPASLTLAGWHWNVNPASGWTSVHSQDLGVSSETDQPSPTPRGSPAEQRLTAGASPTVIGIVGSERGDKGEILLDGDTLSVRGIQAAGEYTGKADLTPGQDGGEADVTVKVKDFVFWPLVMLGLGLGLVLLLERIAGVDRPGFALKIRLRSLQDEADRDRQRARVQIGSHLQDERVSVPIVYRRGATDLLLNALADDAIVRWRVAVDQDDRDEWKSGGEEFKLIKSQAVNYRTALDGLILGAQLCSKARAFANELEVGADLAGSPVFLSFRELLLEQEIRLSQELDKLQTAVDSQTGYLSLLKEQLKRITEYLSDRPEKKADWQALGKIVLKESGRELEGMWKTIEDQQPATAPTSKALSKTERKDLLEALGGLGLPVFAYLAPNDQALGERDFARYVLSSQRVRVLASDTEVIRELEGCERDPNSSPDRVVVLSSGLQDQAALEPLDVTNLESARSEPAPSLDRPEDLRRSLARVDFVYTFLGGTITVLSGLSALYYTNATFGTVGHYVSLFLWGSAFGSVAEAVKKYLPATR